MAQRRTTRSCLPGFLKTAAVVSAMLSGPLAAEEKKPAVMPSIQLGPHRISRWPAGTRSRPPHSTTNLSRCMLEYFTVENTAAFCAAAPDLGLAADHTDKAVAALRLARERVPDEGHLPAR